MYRIVFTAILAIIFGTSNLAAQQQGPHISFDEVVHDYGQLLETDGISKYNFEFTNTGSTPLIINRVNPSCGCTSSNYTKKPIQPGEKGFVSAEYNPTNRPGPFNKTIRVYSNCTDNPTIVLRIKGDVAPKPRSLEDDYPTLMDGIRLDNTQFAFMNVTNKDRELKTLNVVNISDKPVKLEMERIPPYIDIEFKPATLKPGEKGVINATFHGNKTNDLGYVRGRMSLKINGELNPRNSLATTAMVKEDFSHLTKEEMANAPKIVFEENTFDFNTITQGEVVEHKYTFKNEGKSDLIIRKVHASCGCTAIAPPKEAIKPGESSSIEMKFNSRGKLNRQHKTIRIYSNDPDNSVLTLVVKGEVKKK
ncbi:MAG: DUF1573 domain-containing protein [Salinivirgaceae bacterium]|jgi:hypothetical protein|nr:DUF1573 domain-containing protein [Salinivirgaceae bacterium]